MMIMSLKTLSIYVVVIMIKHKVIFSKELLRGQACKVLTVLNKMGLVVIAVL